MLKTTLNEIKAHSPCADFWEKLLKSLGKTKADDEPLGLDYILESNGISDCVWSLRTQPNGKLIALEFAIFCAERVLPIYEESHPDDKRPRKAIEAARQYLKDPSSAARTAVARTAASRASAEAARAADSAAAWAADAAWSTAAAARAAWASAAAARAAWAVADACFAAAAYNAAYAAADAANVDEEHSQKQELLRLLEE